MELSAKPIKKMYYSFKKGCDKVSKENYMPLQIELSHLLGCSSKQQYYQKRLRIPNLAAHIKLAIEDVFAKYGVTDPNDIWDITEQ